MSRNDALRAVKIYRDFVRQTEQVARYLSDYQCHVHAVGLEVPIIQRTSMHLTHGLVKYCADIDQELFSGQDSDGRSSRSRLGVLSEVPGGSSTMHPTVTTLHELEAYEMPLSKRLSSPFSAHLQPFDQETVRTNADTLGLPFLRHQSSSSRTQNQVLEPDSNALHPEHRTHAYHPEIPKHVVCKVVTTHSRIDLAPRYQTPLVPVMESDRQPTDVTVNRSSDFNVADHVIRRLEYPNSVQSPVSPIDNPHQGVGNNLQESLTCPCCYFWGFPYPPRIATASPSHTPCFRLPMRSSDIGHRSVL